MNEFNYQDYKDKENFLFFILAAATTVILSEKFSFIQRYIYEGELKM